MSVLEHIAARPQPCLVPQESIKDSKVKITRTVKAYRNGEEQDFCVIQPSDAQAALKSPVAKPPTQNS